MRMQTKGEKKNGKSKDFHVRPHHKNLLNGNKHIRYECCSMLQFMQFM